MEHIFKAVMGVREAIGEGFTSADVELVVVAPGTAFEARRMEDAWGGYGEGAARNEVVAGTTGLGVRMVKKSDDGEHSELVLQPKVVLESTMRSAVKSVI